MPKYIVHRQGSGVSFAQEIEAEDSRQAAQIRATTANRQYVELEHIATLESHDHRSAQAIYYDRALGQTYVVELYREPVKPAPLVAAVTISATDVWILRRKGSSTRRGPLHSRLRYNTARECLAYFDLSGGRASLDIYYLRAGSNRPVLRLEGDLRTRAGVEVAA